MFFCTFSTIVFLFVKGNDRSKGLQSRPRNIPQESSTSIAISAKNPVGNTCNDQSANEYFGVIETIKLVDPVDKRATFGDNKSSSPADQNPATSSSSSKATPPTSMTSQRVPSNGKNSRSNDDIWEENESNGQVQDEANQQDGACALKPEQLTEQILRVGLPSDALLFASEFSPAEFHRDVLNREKEIYIWISDVYSPTKFWFNIDEPSYNQAYEQMIESLNDFFDDREKLQAYRIHPSDAVMGRACAALYKLRWHRAEIVSNLDRVTNQVTVFYVDHGTTSTAMLDDIRHLSRAFVTMPRQANRGRLACVRPLPKSSGWELDISTDATNCMLQFVGDKMVYAKIYAYEEIDQIFHLVLYDVQSEAKPYCINKKLANYDFCEYADPKYEVFPIPEDIYPSFDMLEKGISPSYVRLIETNGKRPIPPKMNLKLEGKKIKRQVFGISSKKPAKRPEVEIPLIDENDEEYGFLFKGLPPPYVSSH